MQTASGPKHGRTFLDKYRAVLSVAALILLSFCAQGQKLQPINSYGSEVKRLQIDTSFAIPTGCGVPSANPWLLNVNPAKNAMLYYDTCGHVLWVYDPKTPGWSGITSGSVLDTTSLSNRINLKLNFADTTTMLNTYARKNQVVMSVGVPFFSADVAANRPAFGNIGYLYLATDTKLLYRDNGGSWDLIGGGGGGGGGISLTSLSALPPIVYNNSTGVFSADTSHARNSFSTFSNLQDTAAAIRAVQATKQSTLTGPGYVKQVAGAPTYVTAIPLSDLAVGTPNRLRGIDNSGNQAEVIIDAPLQLISGHLKDTSTNTGGGGSGITQLTGPVTAGPGTGSQATSVTNNALTNAMLAQMPAGTVKGNLGGSTANAADVTIANLANALPSQFVKRGLGVAADSSLVLGNAKAIDSAVYINLGNAQDFIFDSVGAHLKIKQLALANTTTTTLLGRGDDSSARKVVVGSGLAVSTAGVLSATGAGSTNVNVGSDFRFAIPSTNNIKTFHANAPLILDSTSNANAITIKGDTTAGRTNFATQSQLADSAATKVYKSVFTTKGDIIGGTGSGTYGRLGAGSAGSVLTPDISQTTGLRWAIQPAIYLVTDPAFAGGAKGDGHLATDGAMLVGSNILVSNQATFVPADTIGVGAGTGKVILIKGVGASGNDTLTRITGYTDAHHITVAVNASTGGGGHIFKYGHDDTPAFQAALNAIYANGGGTLIVPSLSSGNFYPIAGPLIHTDNTNHDPNSQIYFPSENFPESSAPDSVPYVIMIKGDVPPTTEFGALTNDSSQIYTGGCMLQSLLTANYGQGSVIGSAVGATTPFGVFTAITGIVENIFVEVPDGLRGAYRSGIDFNRAQSCQIKNVTVKTDVPAPQTHDPVFTVFGIRMTGINGNEEIYLDGFVEVAGFKFGYVFSEHTAGNVCAAKYCKFGILAVASNHAWHLSTFKSHWCANDLFADTLATTSGVCKIQIDQVDIEAINPGKWYDHNHGVNDSLHLMTGTIGYFVGGTGTFNPTTTNLILSPLGDQLKSSSLVLGGASKLGIGNPAWYHQTNNASAILYTGNNVSGNTGHAQLVLANSQSSTNSFLGDLIWSNMSAATYNASILGYTGAALGDGKLVFDVTKSSVNNVSLTMDGATNTFALPVVMPAATASIPSMNIPLSSGTPPSTQGNFYATLNHLWYYDNGAFKDILAGGGGGGGTAAGSTGDVQFTNANGGFSTLPSSLFHMDSTNNRLGIGTASPSLTLHLKGTTAGGTGLQLETTNTSTTGLAYFDIKNSGTNHLQMGVLSTGYTTSGLLIANSAFIATTASTQQMEIYTNNQPLIFSTRNGASGDMQISTGHNFLVNTTTDNFTKMSLNGRLWHNKDSVPISVAPSTVMLVLDTITNIVSRAPLPTGGTPTFDAVLNAGSTLTTDRLVSGSTGANSLRFGTSSTGSSLINVFGVYANSVPIQSNNTIQLLGGVQFGQNSTATNANYTVAANDYLIALPVLSGTSKTITLPSATGNTQRMLLFINRNTSGTFSWSFSPAIQDAAGNSITTLVNGTSYQIILDGTTNNWIKIN